MDLTEAEDIKMRWQEYTEEYMDNHDGVTAHLQQTFWSVKSSGP